MKIAVMVALAAMAGMSANARQFRASDRPRVLVYVDNSAVQPRVLHLAEAMADGMFATAGVRIEWRGHSSDSGRMPGGALAIGLTLNTPAHVLEKRGPKFRAPYSGLGQI